MLVDSPHLRWDEEPIVWRWIMEEVNSHGDENEEDAWGAAPTVSLFLFYQ